MRDTFAFETISEAEYQRLHDLYQPMTQSLRRLIDAAIRTGVDDDAIGEARAAIDSVAETLQCRQRTTASALLHESTGRPVAWANPVVGLRNAIAPSMVVQQDDDGLRWAEFTLGSAYEGPPGWVHGGICALILDQILGEAASHGMTLPKFTGTITLRYLRGTPLGPLRVEAFIERVEGFKTYARGYLIDAEGRTVEADGVFIEPAWARDGGGLERSDPGIGTGVLERSDPGIGTA